VCVNVCVREKSGAVSQPLHLPASVPSAAHEDTRPKKELTRVSIVDDAQIEDNWNAPTRAYSVLDHLTIMAENPKQPNKVAFEVRKARRVRFPASTGIRRPHIG